MNNHGKATFQGVINEIPNIAIDYFHHSTSEAFFLSHCHAGTKHLFKTLDYIIYKI